MKVTVQLPERCGAQALLDGPHHRQLSGALGRRLGRRLRDEPRKADQLQPSAEVPRPTQVGGKDPGHLEKGPCKGGGEDGAWTPSLPAGGSAAFGQVSRALPQAGHEAAMSGRQSRDKRLPPVSFSPRRLYRFVLYSFISLF